MRLDLQIIKMCYIKISVYCIIFAYLACGVLGAKIPSDWKLCKTTPDFNNCLVGAIETALTKLGKDGRPDLKIPGVDPLVVPSMTIGEGTGPVNVVQHFTNVKIHGIPTTKVTKVEEDLDHYTLYIETFSPFLILDADYTLNGRVLVLPVQGEGKCNVTLVNVKCTHTLVGEKFERKGKEYQSVKFKLTLDPERVIFKFENLFNGNKELGDSLNAIVNENWKEVFDDVKQGYETSLGIIFSDVANKIYTRFPLDVLYEKP